MPKIVNTALKAKAKAWTFEAKAKAIKFSPRGQGLASRTTSLTLRHIYHSKYVSIISPLNRL